MKYLDLIKHYVILLLLIILKIICSYYNLKVFNYLYPLLLILYSFYILKIDKIKGKRYEKQKDNSKRMIILALIYIILYSFSGLIIGFARSPYSHTVISFIKNVIIFIIPIICIEIIRTYMLNKKGNNINYIMVFLLMFMLEISYGPLINNLYDRREMFKYLSSTIYPLICSSLLYMYLSYKGSYKVVLSYRVPYMIFILIAPIFPSLNWFSTGILGIIVPIIIFIYIKNRYDKLDRESTRLNKKKKGVIVYSIVVIIIAIYSMFMLGLFKYCPIAIMSNSMIPLFERGDAVIYEKINEINLQNIDLYTIIIYSRADQYIVHRVIDIKDIKGEKHYQTKGDANQNPDGDLVSVDQIIGIYKGVIPYLGYPTVMLNQYFNNK